MPPQKEAPGDEIDHDRARKRRAIDATVIKVLAGSEHFNLTRSDVDRRPGSLLHSLLYSIDTAAEGVPVELDLSATLSASQLSTFAYTAAITVVLYRHERVPLQLLSEACKSYGPMDLLDKLQGMLDFLNIPGPVSKYLPVKDSITLRHLSVFDLFTEEAAQRAVNLMLGSSLFSSTTSTGSSGAAFFTVRLKEEVSSHYEVVVFALSGTRLSSWHKGSSDNFSADDQLQAVQLPEGPSIKAVDMEKAPAVYGQLVSSKSHRDLFERISAGISTAVAQLPFRGSTGGVQSCTFTALYPYPYGDSAVWAVVSLPSFIKHCCAGSHLIGPVHVSAML